MRHEPPAGSRTTSPRDVIAATCSHAVQFYEDERFLHEAVAQFLATGLKAGEVVLVIATRANRAAFAATLTGHGFDVDALERTGWLTWKDASDALATFMVGRRPDAYRFNREIGALIQAARRGREDAPVRAFGEMVDVLWRQGNADAALQLEDLWNALADTQRFALLCGYAMGNFYKEAHSAHFQEICKRHSHVLPAESYTTGADDDTRLREISLLQQRARALETEIAHRMQLESALRHSLAERDRGEAERERLLAAARAAREEAEQAGRLKDEFLAVLSHELRTPLNAILGWTQIATDFRTDPQMLWHALEVINRNATVQMHVISDLLDVSRILTGKLIIATSPIDVVEVLLAAIDTVRPAATAKNIELDVQFDGLVRTVTADRDRLQQVVWNLLSNAIKFTPENGHVELRLQREGDHARISVRDNGPGIAPEFLPHVFDRFRQADAGTTRRHGGLGLGLAVVRYLVEAHGGTVFAESQGPGTGATFVVSLPLHAVSAGVPSSPAVQSPLQDVRILIVDDEHDARELFAYVLAGAGASVKVAASAAEAERLLLSAPCDVLVCDLGLPDRDGYAVIEQLRNHSSPDVRRIRAVAVTSYVGDPYRARAVAAGYDACLAKPVQPAQLRETIASLMR